MQNSEKKILGKNVALPGYGVGHFVSGENQGETLHVDSWFTKPKHNNSQRHDMPSPSTASNRQLQMKISTVNFSIHIPRIMTLCTFFCQWAYSTTFLTCYEDGCPYVQVVSVRVRVSEVVVYSVFLRIFAPVHRHLQERLKFSLDARKTCKRKYYECEGKRSPATVWELHW